MMGAGRGFDTPGICVLRRAVRLKPRLKFFDMLETRVNHERETNYKKE